MIHQERVLALNGRKRRADDDLLSWMLAAQRAHGNQALAFALLRANALGKTHLIFFGLTPDFPEADARRQAFLLQGLKALINSHELDGWDPKGFVGVACCFGKHDRPWRERNVPGSIRSMNDAGLRRKFDAGACVKTTAR